jgi:hypothetical protein
MQTWPKNFTLEEMTRTDTGLLNTTSIEEAKKLLWVATYMLQPIRDKWGRLNVTSAFRSFAVNEAVGGHIRSQHKDAEATDFQSKAADIKKVFNWIRESGIKYGQLIYEKRGYVEWIHISMPRLYRENGQDLTIINGVRTIVTAPL